MKMIMWAVSRIKDMVWEYQFSRRPMFKSGELWLKYFRGAYYVVNEDGTR